MENFEPSMQQIDDYHGQESQEKSKTVKTVIFALLLIGVVYTIAHHVFGTVDDQIKDAPYLLKRF